MCTSDGDMSWMLATTPADGLTRQPSLLVTWCLQRHDASPACPAQYPSQSDGCGPRDTLSFGPNWDLSYIVVVALIGNWCRDRAFVRYLHLHCPVSNNPFVLWRRRLGRCCLQWSLHKLVSFVFASDTQCLECPLQHNSKQLESVHCVAVEFHVFNTGIVVIHAIIIVVWTILCASARALIKRNFCFSKIVSQNDAKIWNLFIRKQNLYVTIVMWRCIGWFYTHYNIPLLGRSFCFKTQFYFCRFLQHCGTSQNYTVNYRVSVSARRLWTVLFVYYVTLWYFNLYFSLLYR